MSIKKRSVAHKAFKPKLKSVILKGMIIYTNMIITLNKCSMESD